jgi:hypothetical protein
MIFPLKNSKFYLSNTVRYPVDKQYAFAVILIIFGLGLSQSGDPDPFYTGLGVGMVAMGSFWVLIRLIKELKKKSDPT